MSTKKTKSSSKKITAKPGFDIDKNESGVLRLWGIDFKASKGKLTAEVPADIAEAMINSGKCE